MNKKSYNFSFTHARVDSGIFKIEDISNIKIEDLKEVRSYDNSEDIRNEVIVLEKQFRLNYQRCLTNLKRLETYLFESGFVYHKDYPNWISTIISSTKIRNELNDFYVRFVKRIDDHWIEIHYSFRAEVTSDIDEVSNELFRIYDAAGGSRCSLMWMGGNNIYTAKKIPDNLRLIELLVAEHLDLKI